ncbi:tetratricopeptide repeat protein [Leptolyngbya iicbica]|uniref:Tetratricopeptide repeat protein n=2 Tax=Cyanophyceae TaxID=3028117 RepID=A0A4Q7EA57_9CYAN|nr:tetratricopeptide repeat protein [Leptolyngbya sp. LK]RZM79451.1 tetratricopeptide repeat protein [Leptolyngbya sp. LK]
MNNQSVSRRWSPLADYAVLLGSGVGAVASLATQNAAVATVPMTALVAMGLLNRRRLDQMMQRGDRSLTDLEAKLTTEVTALSDQVSALPTPEAITQLQRSAIAYSDRNITHCIESIDRVERSFNQRLDQLAAPDLSGLHQETAALRDQYAEICTSVSNLSKQVERLSHLPRMESTEADVAQLKTEIMQLRVSLESVGSESKTAQATLQDAVRHLDRRLRQVPNGADPNMLKGEVRELIKAVSDLVPRRDFMALSEKLAIVQESQDSLRQTLDQLRSATDPTVLNGHAQAASTFDLQQFQIELTALSSGLKQVETRLEDISVPFDITAEIRGTTATYLSGLQWQLSLLEQQTQDLMEQQRGLTALPHSRLPGALHRLPESGQPDHQRCEWLMALRGQTSEPGWSVVDQALFQALDEVTERLVLVWPWSETVALDQHLVERFEELLAGGCRLEIGWCHPGDRHQGRLLKSIAQQWRLTTAQRRLLKSTLNQLLPLKQKYPDRFSFKILGTKEQFIVCDQQYAIVGLQSLPATSSVFPELDVRVKTHDPAVITQLLQRFEKPDVLPEDADAYFNRAVTRYDLRDAEGAMNDYAQVLRLTPGDAVALNNRGLIWAERKQYQRALEDFDHALSRDPHLFSARCNRGWLQMQRGYLDEAIADFTHAIQTPVNVAIPYFYRGYARQNLGDSLGAIADFTQAIQSNPRAALPYCYRGAAYQRQGDFNRAIHDLEAAASLMHAQGDHQALAQVTQALTSLKRVELTQPIALHSA